MTTRFTGPVQQNGGVDTNLHKLAFQDLGYAAILPGDVFKHDDSTTALRIIYQTKTVRQYTKNLGPSIRPTQNSGEALLFQLDDGNGNVTDFYAGGPGRLEEAIGIHGSHQGSWNKWRIWRVINGTWSDMGSLNDLRVQWNAVLLPDKPNDSRIHTPPQEGTAAWETQHSGNVGAPDTNGPPQFTLLQQWRREAQLTDPDDASRRLRIYGPPLNWAQQVPQQALGGTLGASHGSTATQQAQAVQQTPALAQQASTGQAAAQPSAPHAQFTLGQAPVSHSTAGQPQLMDPTYGQTSAPASNYVYDNIASDQPTYPTYPSFNSPQHTVQGQQQQYYDAQQSVQDQQQQYYDPHQTVQGQQPQYYDAQQFAPAYNQQLLGQFDQDDTQHGMATNNWTGLDEDEQYLQQQLLGHLDQGGNQQGMAPNAGAGQAMYPECHQEYQEEHQQQQGPPHQQSDYQDPDGHH